MLNARTVAQIKVSIRIVYRVAWSAAESMKAVAVKRKKAREKDVKMSAPFNISPVGSL